MQRFRPRATYANVMATTAVFIALGGGAYAATQLPKNSVGTRQIKNNAVNSSKVKNGSLLKQDFKAGQLPSGAPGPPGAQGIQGSQGIQGQKGDTGAPGISGWQLVNGYSAEDSNSFHEASANCPAGKKAIGAGGQIFVGPADAVALSAVIIFLDGSGARADGREVVPTSSNWSVNVEVICANVAP